MGQVIGQVAGWVGSAWFAALATAGFWEYSAHVSVTSPNRAFAAITSLAGAALLLFPPLWKREEAMHWKYLRLFAAVILAGIGLGMPITTHAVRLDLTIPQSSSHGTPP